MSRRTEITEKEVMTIQRMAGLGMSIEQIGHCMGIAKATFNKRLANDKKFLEHVEVGRTETIRKVSETAYELAVSGKVPTMTMFWLKCRAGWNDQPAVNIFVDITGALNAARRRLSAVFTQPAESIEPADAEECDASEGTAIDTEQNDLILPESLEEIKPDDDTLSTP